MIKNSVSRFTSIVYLNLDSFLMNLKAPSISRKAKEAIKVGLAFAIAYLIALQAGWLSPFWAVLTVGQIALFPNAQSLHNGALRILALIPAIMVATFIFIVAGQDRWLFVTLAVLWMMLATYLMIKDQKRSYMWNVAGFVTFIFLTTTFTTSGDLFSQMAARALDTTMGIIVYTLVAVFIWPDSNIGMLKKTAISLTAVQNKIFTLMASQHYSEEDKNAFRQAIKQEIVLANGLKQAFFAKGAETYQVQEAAEFWKEYHTLSTQLGISFSRLNNSSQGLENIDIYRLMPELDTYREVITQRFTLAEDILKNGNREFKTEPIALSVDESYLTSLSPFDHLAFVSGRKEFEKVEELSRKILRCANNIMDESVHQKEVLKKVPGNIYERLTPDIDLVKRLLFIGSFVFLIFCFWIYMNPPGHMMWFYIPPTVAMMVAGTPQMKTNHMILPTFFILSFFIIVYSIVLPRLSGVVELFLILFICMFLVMYYLDGVLKVVGVIGVSTKLMLTNDQVYNFSAVSNMLLCSLGTYISIYMYSYLLDSPRPQRAVLKIIGRYHRSAQFLTSVMASEKQMDQMGIWMKFKIAFHRYELKTLPFKMRSWLAAINHKHFPKNTPDEIEDMLIGLNALSHSFDEWFTSNSLPQTALMLDDTKKELEAWRSGIEDVFKSYSHHFDRAFSTSIEEALEQHVRNLEAIVNSHATQIKEAHLTEEEKENMFRLMGSYQGLSHALVAYAKDAEKIDWKHWEEEVFA